MNFTKEQKQRMTEKLQHYLQEELSVELGQFDAEFLFDFIANNLGSYFYNQGIYDAQTIISQKAELLAESLYEIEKVTD